MAIRMVNDCDGLAEGRRDVVIEAFEVDGMGVIDAAAAAQREMKIEE